MTGKLLDPELDVGKLNEKTGMRDYITQRSHKGGRKIMRGEKRSHTEWKKVSECHAYSRERIQKMYEGIK